MQRKKKRRPFNNNEFSWLHHHPWAGLFAPYLTVHEKDYAKFGTDLGMASGGGDTSNETQTANKSLRKSSKRLWTSWC